jgi:hypothetical protein
LTFDLFFARAGADCRLLQSAISRSDLGITGPEPRSVLMHALPVASRNRRLQTTKSAPAGLRGWGKTGRGDCGVPGGGLRRGDRTWP